MCWSCGDLHQRWKELKLHDIYPLDQIQDGTAKVGLVTLLASKQKREVAQHILPLQEHLVAILERLLRAYLALKKRQFMNSK